MNAQLATPVLCRSAMPTESPALGDVRQDRVGTSVSCNRCGWLPRCGGPAQKGIDLEQEEMWGCFTECTVACRQEHCDWTCPNNRRQWLSRWAEVGGLFNEAVGSLRDVELAQLPLYLPVIRHGKRRRCAVNTDTVALSLYEVVRGRRDGGYGRIRPGATALRKEFKLRPDCRVTLISVGPDALLERFWHHHRAADIPHVLAELNLTGVSAPNFSFFTDAPRTHSLWNRARMLRVAERLSAAGVATILHLNASNPQDWLYWGGFLREHSNLRCVAKEFQTGLAHHAVGLRAFDALTDLQQRVGRELHPVLIGGARYLRLLGERFNGRGTVVDSRPFMNTINRRIADCSRPDGKLRWRKCQTVEGGRLDALLDFNLAQYRTWTARQAGIRVAPTTPYAHTWALAS